jgi:hypothetical protein
MKTLLVVAAVLCSACFTSGRPEQSGAARSIRGTDGSVLLRTGNNVDGELLEVGSSTLAVLTQDRIVVIPFVGISRATFGSFRSSLLSSGAARSTLEQGRSASRFPHGMPPAARDAILQSIGQTRVDTLSSAAR